MSLTGIVYAQNITVDRPAGFQVTDVGTILSGAIGAAFIIAGLLVFGYLVWGGIQWITAGGDKLTSKPPEVAFLMHSLVWLL